MHNYCEDCDIKYELKPRWKQRKYPHKCTACACRIASTKSKTHGERCNGARSKEYRSWIGMRDRIYTKTNPNYVEGVKIYGPWSNYLVYKKWLSENGFNENSQIRRIDSSGDFVPENIKVINQPIKKYDYNGKMLTGSQIYDIMGSGAVSKKLFSRRLRTGWAISKAIMEPEKFNKHKYKGKRNERCK